MPMWRCPHCGTPQAETAHCWVCRRSSTACLTCRHYRRSVAAKIGFCGLDARRLPLNGDEIRPCWEAGPSATAPSITAVAPLESAAGATSAGTRLAFIEVVPTSAVGPSRSASGAPAVEASAAPSVTSDPPVGSFDRPEPRWSLWED